MLRLWTAPGAVAGGRRFTAQGHTRGQQLVRVAAGAAALYFVADLSATANHVRIPFVMGYDVAAIETMAEKRACSSARSRSGRGCASSTTRWSRWASRAAGDDFAWGETVSATATEWPAQR